MSKKRGIILSVFTCIIGVLVGVLICIGVGNDKNSDNAQFLNNYSGGYESEGELIDFLNNNPLDEIYSAKLEYAKTPSEHAIVIGEWIDAYDNELDLIYDEAQNIIDSQDDKNADGNYKEALNNLEKMKDLSEKYMSYKHNFFEDFRLSTLGYGTGLSAELGVFDLNAKRTMLFEMIELMYGWSDSITFIDSMKK